MHPTVETHINTLARAAEARSVKLYRLAEALHGGSRTMLRATDPTAAAYADAISLAIEMEELDLRPSGELLVDHRDADAFMVDEEGEDVEFCPSELPEFDDDEF
jgi:hypothetical protein